MMLCYIERTDARKRYKEELPNRKVRHVWV